MFPRMKIPLPKFDTNHLIRQKTGCFETPEFSTSQAVAEHGDCLQESCGEPSNEGSLHSVKSIAILRKGCQEEYPRGVGAIRFP